MTASSDKVQFILETSLQESIPLVRRGIFSQGQLQGIMHRRQKCEHAMLKKQYKKTDYLGSIEYEYELERLRRKRMTEMSKLEEGSNPLFRKESASDFSIVKRIIRLWDRTMHKYKFQLGLWKEYLSFCICIKSKKHFYKTLTNSLRFLPHQVDLWKIGAAYEMEHGFNMWKGRRILIKGLKMIPSGAKNVELAQFMISYEVHFLRKLIERQNILIKGEEPMKFIGQDQEEIEDEEQSQKQQPQQISFEQYDQLVWLIVEEAISKNSNSSSKQLSFNRLKSRFHDFMRHLEREEQSLAVKKILKKVLSTLNSFEPEEFQKENLMKQQSQLKIEVEEVKKSSLKECQDVNVWKQRIVESGTGVNWQVVQQALKRLCLKPAQTSEILNFVLDVNPHEAVKFISTKRSQQKLPCSTILNLIHLYFQQKLQTQANLIKNQIDRWITPHDLKNEEKLFESIVKFNANENRFESTTRLLRSLSIAFRNEPEYLSECNKIGNSS